MLDRAGDIASSQQKTAATKSNQTHVVTAQDFTPTGHFSKLPRKNPKPWWLIVAGVVLVVAVAAAVMLMRANSAKPAATGVRAPVVTVTTEVASVRPLMRELTVNGTIWAWDPLSVGSQVNGLRIDTVQTEEGRTVRRGQILATLDSSVLRAQLRQAMATLKASGATYRKSLQPNRPEDINALRAAQAHATASIAQEEANLIHASASLTNAKQNAARYKGLLEQGAVSTQETETRDTALQVAEADLRNAEEKVKASKFMYEQASQRLLMAERGGRAEDIEYSAAGLEQMTADVSRLQAQIEQTIIRAPDDGLIVKRDAHIGDIATTTKPLFTMVRQSRLELRAQVPEVDLPYLKSGQVVLLTASGAAGKAVEGKVREISPQVDSLSRLGTARIDVPGNAGLLPGMFVTAQVKLGEQNTLAVPSKAVLSRNDQSFVFTINGNTATQRPVVTGSRSGDLTEILSGISPGDQLIVAGAGFLKDGDPVRLAPSAVPGTGK